ncbi:MAG: hypothetical protein R3C11_03470 [Planctomycetaceae bacterium]
MREEAAATGEEEPARNAKQGLLPDLNTGSPEEIWQAYFKEKRSTETVSRVVQKLLEQDQHKHVIAVIKQSLLAGHSQPWMYEVLAFSMRLEEYPQKEIDRVLLSNVDFQASDVPHLLVSAAYLNRLEAKQEALKLYRQAAELIPTQVEAYLLGLKVAEELNDAEGILWGATGILVNAMDPKYKSRRLQAENVLEKLIQKTQTTNPELSQEYAQQFAAALQQDLRVRVSWTGAEMSI